MDLIEMFIRADCILARLETFRFFFRQLLKINEEEILEVQVCELDLVGYLLSLGAAYWNPSEMRLFRGAFFAIFALIKANLV